MVKPNADVANKGIEGILELSADAHIRRRGTVKDSPEFHRLTGAIAAYGKALAVLRALQKREEFYAVIQESDGMQTLLAGEGHLLELISTGVPLPQVLNKVCTALDVQLGNVVSLVLLPDNEEHTAHTIANTAAEFGLSVFSRTAILSPSEELFGTFEIYCCFLRTPAPSEDKLIQRATHLAALAIQHHYHGRDPGNFSLDWNGAIDRGSREASPSRN
jgi:hypothetical protein